MARKIDLVIIDPQNSFCKVVSESQQQVLHDGELCIPGAWEDMVRLAELVRRASNAIDDIHVTLDSHHPLHVSHPMYYKDSKGNQPIPFTCMREENDRIIGSVRDSSGNFVDVGEYFGFLPFIHKKALNYLKSLAAIGRHPHIVWPPHCLIGSPGHNIVQPLFDALLEWETKNFAALDIVTKGSNFHVEHFSAVQAEVVDPSDNSTQLNTAFIELVHKADEIWLAGEAGSHCLPETVFGMANYFQDDSFIRKCTWLTDATSPVPGFEKYQEDAIQQMTKRGMKTAKCADVI